MPNANAVAGKAYENAIVTYVNAQFPLLGAFKISQPSFRDLGDIRLSNVVLQAKLSTKGTGTVTRYLREAMEQTLRHPDAHHLVPAVIVHRGDDISIGDDMVVLRAADFFRVVNQRDLALLDQELKG